MAKKIAVNYILIIISVCVRVRMSVLLTQKK